MACALVDLQQHIRRLRKTLGGSWGLSALTLALLAGAVFAAHPVLHPGPAMSHAAHSQSSVPDHCTLCQNHQDSSPAETPASWLELFHHPKPAPVFYETPVRREDPVARSLSPRAPPAQS